MLDSCLDRQVWHMLTGRLGHLAQGGDAAKRIDPRYGPFAAVRDCSAEAWAALGSLFSEPGSELWFVETGPVAPPQEFRVLRNRQLLQMVASEGADEGETEDIEAVLLGEEHAAAMADLAHETQPGPWASLTHRYGPFYGIFRDGRLAAMAGQRMLPCAGLAEVSGVCTSPDFRGQKLGARLTRHVMAKMRAAGDRPYLHTYADNTVAVELYRRLGFRERREMTLTVVGKAS